VSCQDLVRCLSDYIDGTLTPEDRAEAEAHLVLDTTQCTILLYRTAESPALDAPRREALLRRLEKACRGGDEPV
jgi:anti-sigma factor RsiW